MSIEKYGGTSLYRDRTKLNAFLRRQRKLYGNLVYVKKWAIVSLDDDKQRMRSQKCKGEGFVRQRHATGGGFGPVQHVAVSQLTHFVLGAIINSQTSGDAESIEQLLFDMDADADLMGDVNHQGAIFCIDRGYRLPSVSRMFAKAKCQEIGTIQRRKTVQEFPYTFDHPEVDHNVPSEGIPVSLHARKGNNVALAYRGFKGKVVLLKSTVPMWIVPRQSNFVVRPPPAPPLATTIEGAPVSAFNEATRTAASAALERLNEGASGSLACALELMGDQAVHKDGTTAAGYAASCRHAVHDGEPMDPMSLAAIRELLVECVR